MARKKKADKTTPVESVKHKDKRANIPTEELRDFVKEDENQPKTILYPRDPSLDPQLVWKGKDEQDQQELAVPSVPIYIQEKVHPQTIIEDVRRTARKEVPAQFTLFADFDGLEFEEMIDFYRHGANWSNRMILGDSLYVMTSLAEKEGLKGQVQMIYIDPPYGIKFGSNWQVSTRKRDVKDGKAGDVTRQPEQIRAFRDTWKLGIHSYLAYLRDRLVVARELLTETGSVFVQIGDENVHLVRCLMDEVFGPDNFIGMPIFRKTSAKASGGLDSVCDFLLWYAKNNEQMKYRQLYMGRSSRTMENVYNWIDDESGECRRMSNLELQEPSKQKGLRFMISMLHSQSGGQASAFKYEFGGSIFKPSGHFWKTTEEGLNKLAMTNRLIRVGKTLMYKRYAVDHPVVAVTGLWDDTV